MASSGQNVPKIGLHAVREASAARDADAPTSASNSTFKMSKTGNGVEKSEADLYHERVGCGLFWAVGKFRPTNYMIVSHPPVLGHAIISEGCTYTLTKSGCPCSLQWPLTST